MQSILRDVRHAVRLFSKAPAWALSVAGTLALGIGSATAMFTVGNAVLLRPLPFREPGRLVIIWGRNSQKGLEQERVTLADFADWRARARVFDEIGYSFLWPGSRSTIVRTKSSVGVHSAMVSSSWLRALGVQPSRGRIFTHDEDRRGAPLVAMISDRFWEQQFGRDPSVIGRTLVVDSYNVKNYQLVGIMPPGLQFPVDTDVWLSLGAAQFEPPTPGAGKRCCDWLEVIARLRHGVSVQQAQAELNGIQTSILAEHGPVDVNPAVAVTPLARFLTADVRQAILLLMAAVACVLLIACVNAANLLLARAGSRKHEIAIRSALGASPVRITRQLLTESVLLSTAGGIVGLGLGFAALKILTAVAPAIPRLNEIRPDTAFVGICAAVALLTGIGFGLAPALEWRKSSFVHGQPVIGQHRRRLRDGLVIAEVALSTVLLAGAALLMRSLERLQSVDPGFRAEGLLTAEVDMTSAGYSTSAKAGPNRPQLSFRRILEQMRSIPGVVAASGTNRLPLAGIIDGEGMVIATEDNADDRSLRGDYRAVTPEYFNTIGTPMLRGRAFSEADTDESEPVVIVNAAAAKRYWPGRDPLGRRIEIVNTRFPSPVHHWMRVVGVVSDIRHAGLESAARPQFYVPYMNGEWRNPYIVVRTSGDPASFGPALRREITNTDTNAVVADLRPMESLVADSISQPRFRTRLLAAFSLLALLLALAGVYSVMSYLVGQRTAEIGLRMALGASAAGIFTMVVRRGAMAACAGLAIGICGALALRRLIDSLLFETSSADPMALSAVAVVLLIGTLAACWGPSRRAARVDPLVALRHEN